MKILSLLLVSAFVQAPGNLKDLEAKYGHKIDVRQAIFTDRAQGYKVEGSGATPAAMDKYALLWVKEWSIYPAGIMAKANVAKIVFCEKLSLDGQIRAAVPAFDLNTMDFDPALGAYAPSYQRGVIHHEFFHMMDFRMGKFKSDPEWLALNSKEFKYGSGGKNMRTEGAGNLTADIPGFLTPYATTALEEDKAELCSHLIVSTKVVMDRAAKDPILAAKVALLKKRMESYDPGFNAYFWPKP